MENNIYYNSQEDKKMLCRYSESHKNYAIAERCMKVVNQIRLKCYEKLIKSNV